MTWVWLSRLLVVLLLPGTAIAQASNTSASVDAQDGDVTTDAQVDESIGSIEGSAPPTLNPVRMVNDLGRTLDALGVSGAQAGAADAAQAGAANAEGTQGPPLSNRESTGLSASLSIIILLTVITLLPAVLVMCTSFIRIVVVLSLLRQAIGTQTLPPSQIIVGLSLFLTLLVMAPTLDRINTEVLQPMQDPAVQMTEEEAWEKAKAPLRDFMFAQIEHAGNWDSVYMLMEWREPGSTEDKSSLRRKDVDMLTLIPAFMISELKVAFLMGFRLYLPFLVIDMVIASVLISMGMMMLPPVLISLPFKLLLFVLVDGWNLVVANLLTSFAVDRVGVG
ncbi:MAG: flagellar type III secretion system pore protein FliP [Planctomycetota bacterium]